MRFILVFNFFICFLGGFAHADQRFYGSWLDADTGLQLDILDGFKPNKGPILIIEKDGKVSSNVWEIKEDKFSISIGYESYEGLRNV